jgi:hypothetical protein
MDDSLIRLKGMFRVPAKTLNFLYAILSDDLVNNPLCPFEVEFLRMKLEVKKKVAISS